MNEQPNEAAVASSPSRWAFLTSWLAARPRGRWATARGRWAQTCLTASLLLAGLAAWALALVQPWTGRSVDPGIVMFAGGMDTEKIRAAAAEVEQLCAATPREVKPLRRNPFLPQAASAATVARTAPAPGGPETQPPTAGAGKDAASSAGAAPAMLDVVKGLRLEVVLTTPTGERWAVINGQNLREGDKIAGLEISEIRDGRVKLQQAGMTCLLRMD
jgi:hypothetical protein